MARVKSESRCRIGIVWFDSEAEAQAVADHLYEEYPAESIAAANMGYVHVGRDRGFDTDFNGQPAYAVVIP